MLLEPTNWGANARSLEGGLGSCGHMLQVGPQELLGYRHQTRALICPSLAVNPWEDPSSTQALVSLSMK